MSRLWERVRNKLDRTLDPLYRRVPAVHRLRHRLAHIKHERMQKLRDQWYSQANLAALNQLSARRFDTYACESALMAPIPEQWPELDLSIVTYNSAGWIEGFFASLVQQDYPLSALHVYFVDHGSSDQTLEKLRQLQVEQGQRFARFDIVQQDNLGFGAGHDRAIRQGSSAYCLVTNVDIELLPDSLTNVVRTALSDTLQKVASWELRQIPYEHPKYYDAVTLECNWSSHACILLRRQAYEQVGGYDERIFMYCEDVEMSYRFRSYGYVLKYVPKATIHHYTYESAGQVKPLQYSGSLVGNMYVRLRYGSWRDRWVGWLLYRTICARPEPFAGAAQAVSQGQQELKQNWRHFRKGKGSDQSALFPFYGLDYEYHRDGAFYEVKPFTDPAVPLVSVITRTYQGRAELLKQAIYSVFQQTYPNIELVVVEDGGSHQQAVVELMQSRAPEHVQIRYISNPKLGRSAAGNAALAVAKGEWFLFLDDDDLLFADHVETLATTAFANPELSAAYSLAIEVFTEMNEDRTAYTETVLQVPAIFHQEWDYSVMEHHNFIPIQAILFHRRLYEVWGGFDVELDQLEDWHLWQRYGYGAHFQFVPKATSLFRSPAQSQVRSDRAQLLHVAYETARNKALLDIAAQQQS